MTWPETVFISISSVAGIMLIVVAIWQVFKTWQTRMTTRAVVARDEAYRKLAEEVSASMRQTADELADLRQRVIAIETILREVG